MTNAKVLEVVAKLEERRRLARLYDADQRRRVVAKIEERRERARALSAPKGGA